MELDTERRLTKLFTSRIRYTVNEGPIDAESMDVSSIAYGVCCFVALT